MPTYEMPLLIRLGTKAEYTSILKSVANSIFETGGFIRKIENWGDKDLPCKTSVHDKTHRKAAHFLFCFDCPPSELTKLKDDCNRNLDIIRSQIYKYDKPSKEVQCTFEEEMLPPPYRPNVLKIMEIGMKQKRKNQKFQYNSGLDYYPFIK